MSSRHRNPTPWVVGNQQQRRGCHKIRSTRFILSFDSIAGKDGKMAGEPDDGGGRRLLPSWMFGSNIKEAKSKHADQIEPSEAEKQGRNISSKEAKPRKQRGKRVRQEDVENQGDVSETSLVKERKERAFNSPRKRNSGSIGSSVKSKPLVQSPSDEEEDLTVEDLDAIAKEYLQADEEEKRRGRASNSECRQLHNSSRAVSEIETRTPVIASESDFGSSIREENNNIGLKSGNAAQDMIDLLLGPLLQKTVTEERKEPLVINEPGKLRKIERKEGAVEAKKKRCRLSSIDP